MKQSSILLLGGGGFLGSAIAGNLSRKEYHIHILGRNSTETRQPKITFHRGNIEDKHLIKSLLPECDTVIHLASDTTPGSSAGKPLLEAEMNIIPTLKFLETFRDYGNQQIIFISSGGTIYGNPETIPVNENHHLRPLSYHGAGKIAIESFLHAFDCDTGKKITILRPSNFYGPGQSFKQGFGFIRTVLELVKSNTEIKIWGDGNIVRDFLYIDDMVECIDMVIRAEPHSEVYNVGSGIGHSLNDVLCIVEKTCGITLKKKYQVTRKVDAQKIILDCTKIEKKLGWKPAISLEQGINLTWQWMLQQ
jgi:UDP-glucose 4-epimerase